VSAVPEVTVTRLDRRDHFLILGSDGLWDVFSNVQAVNIVSRVLAKGGTVQDAKHTCVPACSRPFSADSVRQDGAFCREGMSLSIRLFWCRLAQVN
jgi:hypothetical protein